MIWAGLQHEDKGLTPDSVMELVDDYSNVQTVMIAMGKAFAGLLRRCARGRSKNE